jgi:hypothetical protein
MTVTRNSWKSHYGAVAVRIGTHLPDLTPYSKLISPTLSDNACFIELNQMSDLCAIATQDNGRVHLIHQFHFDPQNPLNPKGTNQLWTLVGSEAHVGTMTIPLTAMAQVESLVPEWSALRAIVDRTSLLALTSDPATATNPKVTTRRLMVIPHFLAKSLMDTGLDDAAELCIWAIKALNDFDTAANTATPAAAAAAATSTAPDAASTFRDVAYFLWMAATKVIQPAGLTLNMSSAPATEWISFQQRRIFGLGTVPGAPLVPPPGLPPPPPGMSSTALNNTLTNLDGTLGKLAQETELARTSKERATSATARALTKFGHLPEWTKNMILRATEPLPADAMDENGDIISVRTTTAKTYTDLLQVTTVGSCKQYLDHLLNDVLQCATNIPMSTCQAIHTGTLRWSNPDFPQAFSLFACPYSGAMPNSARLDQEAQELMLKATEGKGLSDGDVQKATKILLYAPCDMDTVAKMIGVFACLLQSLFGEKAPVVGAVSSWIPHIRANQLAYDHLTRNDRLFPTKIGWLIDKSIQIYLGRCAKTDSLDLVDEGILCFDPAQQQIVLGTFTMNGVPAILSSQIVRPTPPAWNQQPGGNGSPGKRPAAGAHLPQGPGQGRPVSNPDLNPDWKVSDGREFSFFLRRMRDAPSCWGPNIQACANYWLRGVCRASCVRAASHSPLPSTCRAKLGQFITSTRTAFQAERHANPPETP